MIGLMSLCIWTSLYTWLDWQINGRALQVERERGFHATTTQQRERRSTSYITLSMSYINYFNIIFVLSFLVCIRLLRFDFLPRICSQSFLLPPAAPFDLRFDLR